MSLFDRIPVSEIRASPEWIERTDNNPELYMTPESRLFLTLPRRVDSFMVRGLAMVTISGRLWILDARTEEERQADYANTAPLGTTVDDWKKSHPEARWEPGALASMEFKPYSAPPTTPYRCGFSLDDLQPEV